MRIELNPLLPLLVLVLPLITNCLPKARPQEREESEDVDQETDVLDPFVEDLKNYVLTIPVTMFEGDAILMQFSDSLNKKTSYRHLDPLEAIAEAVYETKGDDSEKEVLVLTQYQDHIPKPKGDKVKRVYVVLRRAVQLHPQVYFVCYIYVTEAPDNTPGIHNLGGRKVFLEWDFFDHREIFDVRAKSLGHMFRCSDNIFIPCASNETIDYPYPHHPKETFPQNPDVFYPLANARIADQEHYRVVDGYDPEEFIDIYGDLDREVKLGRGVTEFTSDTALPSPYIERVGRKEDEKIELNAETGMGLVQLAVTTVLSSTLGLVKSFEGLFGGIGTSDAILYSVGAEIGIEGTDDFSLSSDERQSIERQVKQNTAGGLGGMITGLESEEKPPDNTIDQASDQINPILAKGRTIGATWDIPGDEKPYVQYGWTKSNGARTTNDAFVGFGACRYHQVKPLELNNSETTEEMLRIYQRALKTQCVGHDTEFLLEIFKDGLLAVTDDKTFELQKNAVHFTNEKLTVKQLKELLRGVQLSEFARAYIAELKTPTSSPTAPDGSTISRSVYTLGQSIIGATAFAQEHIWLDLRHGFKLGRNRIRTLKIAYEKLGEDKSQLGEGDGGIEKELNYNNRVFVMGLIQYMLRGSSPVYNSGIDAFKNFDDFFNWNKQIFEERVNSHTT